MEEQSSASYRESQQQSSHKTNSSANGQVRRNDSNGVSLEPSVIEKTYNKAHHDLDVAAANRKPIVTESKYKVKVAEPGVDTLPLADHDHIEDRVDRKSDKSSYTTSAQEKSKPKPTGESQKGQFIAKPDVYSEKDKGAPKEEKNGSFPWVPILGGAAAIAGAIAGAMFLKKRDNSDVKRIVENGDQRAKGIIGSGQHRVKELVGSGQQKFRQLVGRGDHSDSDDEGHSEHRVKELIGSGQQKFRQLVGRGDHSDSDDEGHSHSHSHSHNATNVHDGGLYKVKQGDNLTKIARKSGKKTWHEIAEKNPSIRNPNLIYPGDRLKV